MTLSRWRKASRAAANVGPAQPRRWQLRNQVRNFSSLDAYADGSRAAALLTGA
jgi:hypothetical protein